MTQKDTQLPQNMHKTTAERNKKTSNIHKTILKRSQRHKTTQKYLKEKTHFFLKISDTKISF